MIESCGFISCAQWIRRSFAWHEQSSTRISDKGTGESRMKGKLIPQQPISWYRSTDTEEMKTKSQYIHQAFCNLEIIGDTARIQSFVKGTNGSTTKCEIELKLQKKVLVWWITVETWNKTALSYQASLNATHSVESGKTYRAVAVCTVWNGSNSESATVTSASVEAP